MNKSEIPPKSNKKGEGEEDWIDYCKQASQEAEDDWEKALQEHGAEEKTSKKSKDGKLINESLNLSEEIDGGQGINREEEADVSEKKEGIFKKVLKESFLKVSGLKAIYAWKDYREEKVKNKGAVEELKEKENLESSVKENLDRLRKKYYSPTLHADEERVMAVFAISDKFRNENKNLSSEELKNKWRERLERVERKLEEREGRRIKAKEESMERYNALSVEEKKKRVEAIAETVYAAGLHASWFTGTAAFVGLGLRLSAPALKSIEQARLDGRLNLNGAKDGILKTFKALNPFSDMEKGERVSYLSGSVRTAFSTWAISRGYDNFFGEGELAGENFRAGFGSLQDSLKEISENNNSWLDKTKNFFGFKSESDNLGQDNNSGLAESNAETLPTVKENLSLIEEVPDLDMSNLTMEDMTEFPKIQDLEVKVPKGQGAIKTFELLKERLEEQYANKEKPLLIQKILENDAEELAKKYGFYNPNSPQESAELHFGDSFKISENGVEYLKESGEKLLLEDGFNFETVEGNFGDKGGEMLDSNKADIGSESFYPDAPGDNLFPENNEMDLELRDEKLQEVFSKSGEVDISSVVKYGEGLVLEGILERSEGERIAQAFVDNLSSENQELLKKGFGNLNISFKEFNSILEDAFGIEINNQDILEYSKGEELNISAESFNKIMMIYANKDSLLTKEMILNEIFGNGEQLRDSLEDLNDNISTEKTEIIEPLDGVPAEEEAKIVFEKDGYDIIKTGNNFMVAGAAIEDMYEDAGLDRDEIDGMIAGLADNEYVGKKSKGFLEVFNKYLFTEEEGGFEAAKKFVNLLIEKKRNARLEEDLGDPSDW